jgi:hypothetical protein
VTAVSKLSRRLVILGVGIVAIAACGPVSVVPTARHTVGPSPSSTPTSDASTSAPPSGIVELAGPFDSIGWRPDGSEVLVSGQAGVRRIDTGGHLIESFPQADAASWVDNEHLAVWTHSSTSAQLGSVEIRPTSGPIVAIAGSYTGGLVSNGHGAIALVPGSAAHPSGYGSFVIWGAGSLSEPMAGLPVAWSPDSLSLVVGTGPVEALGADIEQVSVGIETYPDYHPQPLTGIKVDPQYAPAFSEDSRFVAFSCAALDPDSMCGQVVVDLVSRQGAKVAHQPIGLPLSWLPRDALLLDSPSYPDSGPLREWDGTALVQSKTASGSSGVAASTGAIAASTEHSTTETVVTIYSATGSILRSVPGAGAAWSPDGRFVAILSSVPDANAVLVSVGG